MVKVELKLRQRRGALEEQEEEVKIAKRVEYAMLLGVEEAGGGWYGGGAGGGGGLNAPTAYYGSAGGSGTFGTGGKGGKAYQGAQTAYQGGCGGSGAGGSGYVYTSSTASSYPSGCLLNSSYYLSNAATYAGNTSFVSPTGGNETGHTGNGYARITLIE